MTETITAGTAAGLPLYRRIQGDLRARVDRGDLLPGSRIETELELMERYGVSRATIRQALGGLIAEGLLEIRRGLGTYVRTGGPSGFGAPRLVDPSPLGHLAATDVEADGDVDVARARTFGHVEGHGADL